MMQDGRALQAGTSHYLGQNFAKAANIQYQNRQGNLEFVHTTSWGASTRLIGALIMTHADDNGMRVPPKLAPQQIMIVPITRPDDDQTKVMNYIEKLKLALLEQHYAGEKLRVRVDNRDLSSSDKRWEWIKKGTPLVLEIGMRDVDGNKICVNRRDQLAAGKRFDEFDKFVSGVVAELGDIQQGMFDAALKYQQERTVRNITTFQDFEAYFSKDADNTFSSGQGFVVAKWCGEAESLALIEKFGVTIRCIPFDGDVTPGKCVLTGKPATQEVIFARAY
jgi:prolyl-tRNA synthetase